ncbi:MAG TPA: aspartate aminotransferase family protein [Woeseiaceae bacterium]|nr:aspartate aminotransferase family protein [Woeseiaceae bacterium]
MQTISRQRIHDLLAREKSDFGQSHPRSRQLARESTPHFIAGVQMPWLVEWESPFTIFVEHAKGAQITDVDGNEYIDLCLGDTGAMFGHSPDVLVAAIRDAVDKGLTYMLPTEDGIAIAREFKRRTGLPRWSFALTATDANRFAARIARAITGRAKILVFDGCYHGTHDETLARLDDGVVNPRQGSVGPPVDLDVTTRVVEFNDIEALKVELAKGDVACVLTEPALTNAGMVLPDEGFHEQLRAVTREHGVLLIIDETHTISSGPGGYTQAYKLEPDMFVLGKPIGGGIPAAVYGCSEDIARRFDDLLDPEHPVVVGIGGTLSGNALSLRAVRTMLENVITEKNFVHMFAVAERLEIGIRKIIEDHDLPWHVSRMGARVEYGHTVKPRRTAREVEATTDSELEQLLHLYCVNRGVMITPFHNMMLTSPATTMADVDRHNQIFAECIAELTSPAGASA